MGMLIPWRPKILDMPAGHSDERPDGLPLPTRELAHDLRAASNTLGPIRFALWDWPILKQASQWLSSQSILTPSLMASIKSAAKAAGIKAKALLNGGLFDKLKSELQDSVARGESAVEWRKRAEQVPGLARHQIEAIGRTYSHRALHDGLQKALDDPIVQDEFPYLQYVATLDPRTRASHAALDGKVAHKDSPLAKEFNARIQDWNCRCTLIPLSRADAQAKGIDDNTGRKEPSDDKAQPQTEDFDAILPVIETKPPTSADATSLLRPELDPIYQDLASIVHSQDQILEAHRAATKKGDNQKRIDTATKWHEVEKHRQSRAADASAHQEEIRARFIDRFKMAGNQAAISIKATPSYQKNPEVSQGVRFVESLLGNRDFADGNTPAGIDSILVNTRRKRPHYVIPKNGQRGRIEAGSQVKAADIVHELGHQIEQTPAIQDAMRAFLATRMNGKMTPVALNAFIGYKSFEPSEKTYGADDFEKVYLAVGQSKKRAFRLAAYVGKHYKSGDTEVLSMGIELLYTDAATFAKMDPEWFDLVVRTLRGDIA